MKGWKIDKLLGGWVKDEQNPPVKGLPRPYFSDGKIPPVRDGEGRPLRIDGTIDTARWIQEVNEGKWKPRK